MTGQVHLYLTPARWLTSEMDQLIRSLIDSSSDQVQIVASTTELKQALIRRYTTPTPIQSFPHIATLDDWVIGASGISIRRSPLLDAAARQLTIETLGIDRPELARMLALKGIWQRVNTLADIAIMHGLGQSSIDLIGRQWFPTLRGLNLAKVLSAVDLARDTIGIRDQRFAYRYCIRERWLPLSKMVGPTTLILVGFAEPLPEERRALLSIIGASPLTIIPIPSTPFAPPAMLEWMSALRELPQVQELQLPITTDRPTTTLWQPQSPAEEIQLIVQLVRDAGTTDIGIALADFDRFKGPLATALHEAGIPASIHNATRLSETIPGMALSATVAAICSGFRVRDIGHWLDIRRHCPAPPGYSANDSVNCKNILIQRGLLDTDRWPEGPCPPGISDALWTATQFLTTQSLDTLGTAMRNLGHPNTPNWNHSATTEWASVFQLITQWDGIRDQLPQITHSSILTEAIAGTRTPTTDGGPIRICSLQHAAMVPADIWIIPNATDRSFPPRDHSLGDVSLPGETAIPGPDARIRSHQRWVEWVIGQAHRQVHISAPLMIETEPQVPSGALMATLSTAQITYDVATPHLATATSEQPSTETTPSIVITPLESIPYSASQLEAYQKCPRHYQLSRRLKLEPPSSRQLDLDPDEQGRVIHLIAGQCLQHLQSHHGSPEELFSIGIQWLETTARRLVRAVRGGTVGTIIHRRLLGTVDNPGLLRIALPGWIEFVHEFDTLAVEQSFDFELPDTPIRLRGIIDLVARHRPTGMTVIVDFKTGSTPITKIHLETLEHLQLPLYRLAVQQSGTPVDAGIIWTVSRQKSERKTVMATPQSHEALVPKRQKPMIITPETDRNLMDRIRWIVAQIETGQFPLSGLPELSRQEAARPEAVCRHCSFFFSCTFDRKY